MHCNGARKNNNFKSSVFKNFAWIGDYLEDDEVDVEDYEVYVEDDEVDVEQINCCFHAMICILWLQY